MALGVDVLAPEGYGEIIGGGQRIHDLRPAAAAHRRAPPAQGSVRLVYRSAQVSARVPHGGFGMGIERCVAWICGLEHIRETIAFPRMLYRLHP